MHTLSGVRCFLQGLKLAFAKRNTRFVLAPALTSLVIVSAGLGVTLSYVGGYADQLINALPQWLSFLSSILVPLLYVLGVLAGVWLFGFLAAIIGGIFLGDLALSIDQRKPSCEKFSRQLLKGLTREAVKLRYHIPRLIGLLLLSVIPIINTFTPILWLIFGAWLMAVQFCDYCAEHRGLDFSATLATLRQHRMAAMGFGACATLGMAIPILNFMLAPVAVIGGTLFMRSCLDRAMPSGVDQRPMMTNDL